MNTFGPLAVVPFILSIFFIIWQEDVIFPLIGGLFLGSIIVSKFNPFFGFLNITDIFIINALTDRLNIFTLIIIIEGLLLFSLLNRSGYLNTLRKQFSKKGLTKNRLQYIISLSNLVLFIDRYFSSLLVGMFSRPFAEKKKLTPEKHAFLLNTVTSSVSTIIPFTTLTPLIIASIGTAFANLGISYSPLKVFYKSLPYQYYNIFSVFIVFSTILLNKELFLMKKYDVMNEEPEAMKTRNNSLSFDTSVLAKKGSNLNFALYGTAGSLLLVFGIILIGFVLFRHGYHGLTILNIENHLKIFIGALFTGIIYTILFSLITKTETYTKYKSKRYEISFTLLVTFTYIILAMSIESLAKKFGLSTSLIRTLFNKSIVISFLPLIFFLFSSFISFLCGSFFLTATTVIPLSIRIISLNMSDPLIIDSLIFASVGAVISGATFGDINSPFSLNFIISTATAETSVAEHFNSQITYSLLSFLITAIFGYMLFAVGVKPYLSISSGLLVIAIVFIFLNGETFIFDRIKQLK